MRRTQRTSKDILQKAEGMAEQRNETWQQGKRISRWIITAGILSISALVALVSMNLTGLQAAGSSAKPIEELVASGAKSYPTVTYPVKQFADGKARHFTYRTPDGITIKYFIVRSSDGVIRAAFDACDVCWPSGKGYYQEGDYMVCRNCGKRFVSVKVNEEKGGCNPAPLRRTVQDDQVILEVNDILEGRSYFDFSQRRRR